MEYKGWLLPLEDLMERRDPLDMLCGPCQRWAKNYVDHASGVLQRRNLQRRMAAASGPAAPQPAGPAAPQPAAPENYNFSEASSSERPPSEYATLHEQAALLQKLKQDMYDTKRRVARNYERKTPMTWGSIDLYEDKDPAESPGLPAAGSGLHGPPPGLPAPLQAAHSGLQGAPSVEGDFTLMDHHVDSQFPKRLQ